MLHVVCTLHRIEELIQSLQIIGLKGQWNASEHGYAIFLAMGQITLHDL